MGLLASYLGVAGYPRLSPWDRRAWTSGSVVVMDPNAVAPDMSLKVSVVWRAINVLAGSIAMLPLDVFDRLERGKRPAKDDPWRGPLRLKPNVAQTSFRWRQHAIGHAVLGGNYYAHIRPNHELWPLEPERAKILEVKADGSLVYEYTPRSGGSIALRQDQVFHLRSFSRDGIRGVGAIELMREAVALKLMSQRSRVAFMRNGMRPGVVVTHPGDLGPTGRKNVREAWLDSYGGPEKAGSPLVLDEGMDIKPFQLSSKDAQFVESEHFLVEEFLRYVGGVPGVLVGYADKTATHASAEAFFQSFVTHCLAPWTKSFEQELTCALYREYEGDRFVEFNLDAMLRADSAARAAFYRVMIELGILTRNEVRELENRDPLDGLDEPLTPLNMSKGGADGGPEPDGRRPSRPPADPGDDGDDEEALALLARLQDLARASAGRIVRKEVAAIAGQGGSKGRAARYASDPARFRASVEEFYRELVPVVRESLSISEDGARGYCEQQRDELLARGVGIVAEWESRNVPRLVDLALGDLAERRVRT
jgi:HK97 family phage portal protein